LGKYAVRAGAAAWVVRVMMVEVVLLCGRSRRSSLRVGGVLRLRLVGRNDERGKMRLRVGAAMT